MYLFYVSKIIKLYKIANVCVLNLLIIKNITKV